MNSSRRVTSRSVVLVALMLAALAMPLTATAQADQPCEAFPETTLEICGLFLSYWETNGGLPVFGLPLTAEFSELSADTLTPHDVQYYERERFEHHPENDGTPYAILLGRLGVNVLDAGGIEWMTLPKADSTDPHYTAATGQAIAPEFWAYWSGHGLDLGDAGVSFRESLALFGYPVTPAQVETNPDGDTVLTQWFERARFELHGDEVLLGRLSAEVNDEGHLSIRVQAEMDAILRKNFDAYELPTGAFVSVTAEGLGEWVGNLGVADPATGAVYTDQTHHRIASVTKTFNGTLVLQLVEQGLVDLDTTVDMWFEGVTYGDRITVRMLLNMSSGIANYTENDDFWHQHLADPERIWTPEELLAYGFGAPPLFEPGARYYYSNTNYIMLGLIIEAVTGQDVRSLMQERIFNPLGLTHTSFPADDDTSLPEPYAVGITRNVFTGELFDATNWNPTLGGAAGQIISTQADMRVWARVVAMGELLSPEMQAERLTVVPANPDLDIDVGYGLGIERIFGWLGHGGHTDGYNTIVSYRPDLQAAIVVFLNSDTFPYDVQPPATQIFLDIALLLNREYPLPPASN